MGRLKHARGSCAALLVVVFALAISHGLAHSQTVPDLVDRIRPSIGLVRTRGSDGTVTGTAFVVHSDGYLVTALHVVVRAVEVQVALGGQVDGAEIVAVDRANDLALLRVRRTELVVLPLSGEGPARTGEEVLVVGFPFAELLGPQDIVVTKGIVSAAYGSLPQLFQGWLPITGPILQVDAAMNPGVSGGPVDDYFPGGL